MRWGLAAVGALAVMAAAATLPTLAARRSDREPLPTTTARRGAIAEAVVALGTVEPQVGAEVRVGSQVSGVVERLAVGVGEQVRAGDLLVVLRDDERRAAAAALAADLAAAEAERDLAANELGRAEGLRDLLPAIEIERTASRLAVLAAEVERRRARLAEARVVLGHCEIRAPISGTVASVTTQVGETVAASFAAPTFVTIVDLERLEIQAFVDETDIGRVEVGQAVRVRLDAFPGRPLDGVVRAIRPSAELLDNVVTYVAFVDFVAGGLAVRPAMTAHVDLELARREDAVRVPRAALFEEAGRAWVVLDDGGRWVEREVEVGLRTAQEAEIVTGLAGGETLVAETRAWRRREKEER